MKLLPLLLAVAATSASPLLERRAISTGLFDEFVRAAKLSQAAYMPTCNNPVGTKRVYSIRDEKQDTDGFISVDATKKLINVVLSGPLSQRDYEIAFMVDLVKWTSPGTSSCSDCKVHEGLQLQWNAVASAVVHQVQAELRKNSGYSITVTGHSVAGALASMAAVTLEKAFPGTVTLYALAGFRFGNAAAAKFVESTLPNGKRFRLTHTDDPVPQVLTQDMGYRHYAPEYWMSADPVTTSNIVVCSGAEDKNCNMGVAKGEVTVDNIPKSHLIYMNVNFVNDTASC